MIAKVEAVVARADNAKAICNFFLKRVYYFSCFFLILSLPVKDLYR
jgi:hypothetical protein